MAFPRSLPTRIISVGTPSIGPTTACREKTTRAVERENLAKTSPVASAVTSRLATDSVTITTLAATLVGYIAP